MTIHISRRTALKGLAASAAAGVSAPALAQAGPIRLGGLTTLEGPFATGGQDSFRCMQMLLEEANFTAGGRKIEFIRESSNAQADVALARARKLVEQDNVDIVVGPLSGAEGIALRDYSRTLTGKTIVNGSSGASDTTLRNPSPNFFRFSTEGVQWMAGLGTHVYKNMNVKEVALLAGDYAFPYSQAFGFSHEYCRLGGKVTYLWTPLGTTDYSTAIARIPATAGALVVIHGGTDGLAFMTQYAQAGGSLPLIGGSVMADQTMMSARGPHRKLLVGMISGGPIADIHDDPMWNDFVARYKKRWGKEAFNSPSIHGVNYATNLQAVLAALNEVKGDLSNNQQAFQAALAKLVIKNPMGATVKLDENRQAISDVFMNRIEEREGQLVTVTFGRTNGVSQTLGMPADKFLALGSPSRDNTGCVSGT